MNINELLLEIETSFEGVSLEDGVSLRQAAVIDDYGNETSFSQAGEEDERDDWKSVNDEDLANYPLFSFLDLAGLRFYLPCYMTWTLNYLNAEEEAIGTFLHSLVPPKRRDGKLERLHSSLTPAQRNSVVVFLDHVIEEYGNPLFRMSLMKARDFWSRPQP